MRESLVEPVMNDPERTNVAPGRGKTGAPERESSRASSKEKRRDEYRTAIAASTARIMSIAITRATDSDTDAA